MEIRVIQLPGGKIQIFVDGDISEEMAATITRELQKEFGTTIQGGIQFTSAIEGHRAGGMEHAHIVGETRYGR